MAGALPATLSGAERVAARVLERPGDLPAGLPRAFGRLLAALDRQPGARAGKRLSPAFTCIQGDGSDGA
jgi:hypothetical protein